MTNTTTKQELINQAIEILDNNDDIFVDMVNELDSWNGYADGFRCYAMYELDELFYDCKVSEFLSKIHEGHFDLNDNYFIDTIYGLESADDITEVYRDNVYSSDLLDSIIDNESHLYFNDSEFEELIQAIIEADEEEENDD